MRRVNPPASQIDRLAMSTEWKPKPNSSRFTTTLQVARRLAILAGRRKWQQQSDLNLLYSRWAGQGERKSRMSLSSFRDIQDAIFPNAFLICVPSGWPRLSATNDDNLRNRTDHLPAATANCGRCLSVMMAAMLALCGCRSESKTSSGTEQTNVAPALHVTAGTTPPPPAPQTDAGVRLSDVADHVGINFVYQNGQEQGHLSILESLGGGVGVFDLDLDGQADIVFPGGGSLTADKQIRGRAPALFRQRSDDEFEEVSRKVNLTGTDIYTHGVAAGDIDNDGFPDLLFTGYGGLQLYENHGDGTFSETSAARNLVDDTWSVSAAIADVTGDGAPDIYVSRYVDWSFQNHPICNVGKDGVRDVCPPSSFEPLADKLYRGQADGVFVEDSRGLGLKTDGKGLGVMIADVNGDQLPDIYVANDTVDNFLYVNSADGVLNEVGHQSGCAFNDRGLPDGSMGVAVADLNNDLRSDIWVTNYERESIGLYRNEGNSLFFHASQLMGVAASSGLNVGWGTVLFDVDADGDRDAFVANGHVVRFPPHAPVLQPPLLLENQNGRRFSPAVLHHTSKYFSGLHGGRGVAQGDLDNDNDIDLVVSHINKPAVVLRNDTPQIGNWIRLRLIGAACSRDAIGAAVIANAGDKSFLGQVVAGGSYASESSKDIYFGLPPNLESVDIEVRWPNGQSESWTQLLPNKAYVVLPGRFPIDSSLIN